MAAPDSSTPTSYATPDRLWAEQLAIGLGLFVAVLIFLAMFHTKMLSSGMAVFGPNYISAYGWASVLGIFLQVVVHELGTLIVAWRMKLPIRFRFFGLGANAAAILCRQPRRIWADAALGIAGPATGMVVSMALALTFHVTDNPLFLGMACVGYFYNLFTLVPILELEGGWIAPAIAPQGWLIGIVLCVVDLTYAFNLVMLGLVAFAVPRLILIIRARAPRVDLECTPNQRLIINIGYFVMVLAMAWLGSTTFEAMPQLVRDWMGD
jgi:Zn-dependent protease